MWTCIKSKVTWSKHPPWPCTLTVESSKAASFMLGPQACVVIVCKATSLCSSYPSITTCGCSAKTLVFWTVWSCGAKRAISWNGKVLIVAAHPWCFSILCLFTDVNASAGSIPAVFWWRWNANVKCRCAARYRQTLKELQGVEINLEHSTVVSLIAHVTVGHWTPYIPYQKNSLPADLWPPGWTANSAWKQSHSLYVCFGWSLTEKPFAH